MTQELREQLEAELENTGYRRLQVDRRIAAIELVLALDDRERG